MVIDDVIENQICANALILSVTTRIGICDYIINSPFAPQHTTMVKNAVPREHCAEAYPARNPFPMISLDLDIRMKAVGSMVRI